MATLGETVFVAFDTETTGLFLSSRVVELGAVKFRGLRALETFQSLVNPGVAIPPEAAAVHGITDAEVAGRPSIAEILPQFEAFIGDAVLVAHNAPYDLGILATEYARLRRPAPRSIVLDSCSLARNARLGLQDHKLGTVARHFGIRAAGHRALMDSHLVHQVFWGCLERLGCRPETELEQVLRLAGPVGRLEDYVEILERLPERFRPLVQAMQAGQPITMRYSGGTRGTGPRMVVPQAFFRANGAIYMEAEAVEDGTRKSFRLDRILEVIQSD